MTGIIITGVPADDPVNRAHADAVGYPPLRGLRRSRT
jgi:hypothetical protein